MGLGDVEDQRLRTDDLHDLKEGEIFVDPENGKKYRVRKTLFKQQEIGGPHGVGDPNDRRLRRLEADVLIPQRMNEYIQRAACRETLGELTKCLRTEGKYSRLRKCQPQLAEYDACRLQKFNDPWFRQAVTEEYLKERSEYRRTGKNTNQRNWEAYLEWKKKSGGWEK